MRRLILFLCLILVSGCSYFDNETAIEETSSTPEMSEQSTAESVTPNIEFDNVFGEDVVGTDNYPNTMLPDSIPIEDLRTAVNEYYQTAIPEEEKTNYDEPIESSLLDNLQETLDENDIFEPLDASIDQATIELEGIPIYIARVVVNMSYEEAEDLKSNQDILLLNEALAQVGNRIVMVCYYDEETDTLLPYHLNTPTHSLFSLGN